MAELIANDRPLLVRYRRRFYVPVLFTYPETEFGGFLPSEADYRDPLDPGGDPGRGLDVCGRRSRSATTRSSATSAGRHPRRPSWRNLLGTDDQARDVAARLIYGFRISVLFGLVLTILSSIVGVAAGLVQGYLRRLGGPDRCSAVIEIWSGLPDPVLLIILSSIVAPNFWWLLGLMLFVLLDARSSTWCGAETCARATSTSSAPRARWVPATLGIMWRHVLPNALVSTLTFMPFILIGSIATLTALDFLGFGLPPGSPSLGELLVAGQEQPRPHPGSASRASSPSR